MLPNICISHIVMRTSQEQTLKGHHHDHMRGPRSRWSTGPGRWGVHARVERFVEPALLLLLKERPVHGYELMDLIPEVAGDEGRVDLGNLYRLLRALEEQGIVRSEWVSGAPGPAKRTYELTPAGERVLAQWVEALRRAGDRISGFVERYERLEGR